MVLGPCGVVVREPPFLPWRELRALSRREARDSLRGDRFVHGFAGEQIVLPEAVDLFSHIYRKTGGSSHVEAMVAALKAGSVQL